MSNIRKTTQLECPENVDFWDWWDNLSDQEKVLTGRCVKCSCYECHNGCIESLVPNWN